MGDVARAYIVIIVVHKAKLHRRHLETAHAARPTRCRHRSEAFCVTTSAYDPSAGAAFVRTMVRLEAVSCDYATERGSKASTVMR